MGVINLTAQHPKLDVDVYPIRLFPALLVDPAVTVGGKDATVVPIHTRLQFSVESALSYGVAKT